MICGDCIHKEVCGLEGYFDDALITCIHKTELPHNTGHWITKPNVYGVTYCSECDFELKIDDTNYCPRCGADMRGEQHDGM